MKWIVAHYLGDWSWVKEYTDDYLIFDHSEAPLTDDPRHIKEDNLGYNIYTYTKWIVENYEKLPNVVAFIKGNILERHITKQEFDSLICKENFTPLLTQHHKIINEDVAFYKNGLYHEKNNSWYFAEYPNKYFRSYPEFAEIMGLPSPKHLPFAPGGCYIVPRENILKRDKDFYKKLMEFCSWSQINAESHTIERALYTIWH